MFLRQLIKKLPPDEGGGTASEVRIDSFESWSSERVARMGEGWLSSRIYSSALHCMSRIRGLVLERKNRGTFSHARAALERHASGHNLDPLYAQDLSRLMPRPHITISLIPLWLVLFQKRAGVAEWLEACHGSGKAGKAGR